MNKTELAIIEHIAQLDEVQQQEILEHARQLVNERLQKPFSFGEWLRTAQHIRAELAAPHGEDFFFDTQSILDEIRNEESE